MYHIYIWTHKESNKKYVGATSKKTVQLRAGKDGYFYKGSPSFYAAIQKYGMDAFSVEIVATATTRSAASVLENYYINKFDTMNEEHGYNMHHSGYPAEQRAEATKRQISKTLHEQRSDEAYRRVMSSRMKAVWDDPEQRDSMMKKRKLNPNKGGCQRVQTLVVETGKVYNSKLAAALALGLTASCFKGKGPEWKVFSKALGMKVTVRPVTLVDLKESELLGTPSGTISSQACGLTDRQPQEGSTTIQ